MNKNVLVFVCVCSLWRYDDRDQNAYIRGNSMITLIITDMDGTFLI